MRRQKLCIKNNYICNHSKFLYSGWHVLFVLFTGCVQRCCNTIAPVAVYMYMYMYTLLFICSIRLYIAGLYIQYYHAVLIFMISEYLFVVTDIFMTWFLVTIIYVYNINFFIVVAWHCSKPFQRNTCILLNAIKSLP